MARKANSARVLGYKKGGRRLLTPKQSRRVSHKSKSGLMSQRYQTPKRGSMTIIPQRHHKRKGFFG